MAGALENAQKQMERVKDCEKESRYGYIRSVSGPGLAFAPANECIYLLGQSLLLIT